MDPHSLAQEKLFPYHFDDINMDVDLFCRVDIASPEHLEKFISLDHPNKIATIHLQEFCVHPSRIEEQHIQQIILEHVSIAQKLASSKQQRLVIAADKDGILQKILSPRFSQGDIDQRSRPLLEIFSQVQKMFTSTIVLLTTEELAPGGLDATDGVKVAKSLENLGLKNIIATSGTKDFPMLYHRRVTATKKNSGTNLQVSYPCLASAQWLVENTSLNVWCLADIEFNDEVRNLCDTLGIAGVIRSLHTPS